MSRSVRVFQPVASVDITRTEGFVNLQSVIIGDSWLFPESRLTFRSKAGPARNTDVIANLPQLNIEVLILEYAVNDEGAGR